MSFEASAAEFIPYPRVPGTDLMFSYTSSTTIGASSENGICRALGFHSALRRSARSNFESAPYSSTVRVDDYGRLLSAQQGWSTSRIVCMINAGAPMPNPGPHPVPNACPPGTVWDASLARCVSVYTPPAPRPVTCRIYHFTATSLDRTVAIKNILQKCAISSGGYVCRAQDVRCDD